MTEIVESVSTQTGRLTDALADSAPAVAVRMELVHMIDSEELAAAMVSDDAVLNDIEFMEECYKEEMDISVSVDVAGAVQVQGYLPVFLLSVQH